MKVVRITNAARWKNFTFLKLSCGHERSLGGHVYKGKVQLPSDLTGQNYECCDGRCSGYA